MRWFTVKLLKLPTTSSWWMLGTYVERKASVRQALKKSCFSSGIPGSIGTYNLASQWSHHQPSNISAIFVMEGQLTWKVILVRIIPGGINCYERALDVKNGSYVKASTAVRFDEQSSFWPSHNRAHLVHLRAQMYWLLPLRWHLDNGKWVGLFLLSEYNVLWVLDDFKGHIWLLKMIETLTNQCINPCALAFTIFVKISVNKTSI